MPVGWLAVPRDWIASFGDIAKFCARVFRDVFTLRVFRFFGEALRQAGILILGSALVIWGLAFILGLRAVRIAWRVRHSQPPIGARGFAPQNSWVPSIPMRCTSTMLTTIDFAVAVPTPTGPPPAL